MGHLEELLESLDYLPTVSGSGDGCLLEVPNGTGKFLGSYRFEAGGVACDRTDEPGPYLIPVQAYARRLYVLCHVMDACFLAGIDPKLVKYRDASGREVSWIGAVLPPPADASRETALFELYAEARNAGFPRDYLRTAQQRGVYEGYRVCLAHEILNLHLQPGQ